MHRAWILVCLVLCMNVAAARADELADKIEPLIDAHDGQVAVAIKDLKTGQSYEHNAQKPMPTASLIKLPLMIAAYQAMDEGRLKADEPITLQESDKVPGSGILTEHFSPGATISLHDAIELMIVYSDNTATNLVAEKVGLEQAAELMDKLGCPETRMNSMVFRRDTSIFPERSKKYGLGSTTAADMVKLLEQLSQKKLVSEPASEKMLAHLYGCDDKQKFPRFLPQAKIAHKTGSINEVRTDAGLIDAPKGPIALCVLTNENDDKSWGDRNAAEVLCGRIAQIAYRHFSGDADEIAQSVPDGVLKIGSSGMLVEALQRTLNARMKPSPDLGVDGDFGSMTEGAVIGFQKSKGLQANGIVGPETWAALGALVEEGPEAPEPDEVNAQALTMQPPDSLDGPPFVGCKTWVIADGETGRILCGHDEHEPVDIASTTKIMTAYLVINYAQQHAEALDETVVFSKRADDTIGSTSDLRAGEEIAVSELLYGMMLPSGNDATVAFAEHFGKRLAPGGAESDVDSPRKAYDAFVGAMNATAEKLGMADSHFSNTHGLTDEKHKASAADLAKLACAAMKLPLFREVVGTAQHGSKVKGPGGYERNVLWKNTNHLLGIEGYDGVKTGTTTAAGACLVSHGRRDQQSLIVVVLGAGSSDSRYVDTRNLFRYGWQKLASSGGAQ
ncbi:MAG: serine hydrolase [Pirellulales bacterium]|nr:serine hydrolase [Pirellulales bacterium]